MNDSVQGTDALEERFRYVAETETAEQGPPVDQWDPPDRGALDMRIRRNGEWEYEGNPVKRQSLVRLFASILRLEDDGRYFLVTPVEKFHIEVEDVPFIAHSLTSEGNGPDQVLWLTTNVDSTLAIGPSHPLEMRADPETGEPSPCVRVRRNLYARIERNAFYHLVNMAAENEQDGKPVLGVWSQGQFFSLGAL